MITNPSITVDVVSHLPHGTVRRAPDGFAHAILLDQPSYSQGVWYVVDVYGPTGDNPIPDAEVATWPIVYVPAPDEVWKAMNTQPSYRDRVAEEFGKYDGPLMGPTGEEVSGMNDTQTGQETEQEQKGRGDTHNGPTFPQR